MIKHSETEAKKDDSANSKKMSLIILGLAIIFTAISFFAMTKVQSDYNKQRISNEMELMEFDEKIEYERQDAKVEKNRAIAEVTGVDLQRVKTDTEIIEPLIRKASTWKNMDAYVEARNEIIRAWELDPQGQFLSTFLPGEEQGVWRVDRSGDVSYLYPRANSSMSNFETQLISMKDNDWTYLGVVTNRIEGVNETTTTRPIVVVYTIDGNGKISDIEAYPSRQQMRSSGKD